MNTEKSPYEIVELTHENKVWSSHYENELDRTEALEMASFMARTWQPHHIGPMTTQFAVGVYKSGGKYKIIGKFPIDSISPE